MNGTVTDFDVAIIGAGIAGAAAAYDIARTHKVVVLERESQPGYHTSGRSAALFTETYGSPAIRALTKASRAFLESPPPGFAEHPILSPRGVMMIATHGQDAAVEDELAHGGGLLREIPRAEAIARVPVLRPDWLHRAMEETEARDIDVAALLQGFLKGARAAGAKLICDAEVRGLSRRAGAWHVATTAGVITAGKVVNAAGAWADVVAGLAGLAPIGLVPKRRTAFTFDPPVPAAHWPLVYQAGEIFYFKPESGRLLASPADETPSPPCDAQPEDIDIAVCADKIETATTMKIARIARKWAGLRSFVADKTIVLGPAAAESSFIWLAGQGGYGFQTCAAMSRLSGACLRGEAPEPSLLAFGFTHGDLSPARLGA